MNKNLDSTWAELVRQHPDLAQLPDPDRRPPNECSLDALIERGEQFEPPDWAGMQSQLLDNLVRREARELLRAWAEKLEEPDKTIWILHDCGQTQEQIGKVINRTKMAVCLRLAKLTGEADKMLRKFNKNSYHFTRH